MTDDFYVGYEPEMPAGLAPRIRMAAVTLAVAAFVVASIVATSHSRSAAAVFEYGRLRIFEGRIVTEPFPALEVSRADAPPSWFWLVGSGKHGAARLVAGRDGAMVRLSGTLIQREGDLMIEVVENSLVSLSSERATPAPIRSLGTVTIVGEIVDSKCHLGVMKPGEGPTHRDCAVRCLLGRIPPMLVHDDGGHARRLPLLASDRNEFDARLPALAGRPVRVTGTLFERAGQRYLVATPSGISPADQLARRSRSGRS